MPFFWPRVQDRRVFLIVGLFVAVVWGEYLVYWVFDRTWWLLRFMLPTWPIMMIGMGAFIVAVTRASRRPLVIVLATWLTVIWGAYGLELGRYRGAFDAWYSDRRFIDMALKVRERTPESAVVLTMLQSGSLRYYGGRQTLRFDRLPPEWLDRTLEWLVNQDVHPYALFSDPVERADFEHHFEGQRGSALPAAQLVFSSGDLPGEPSMEFYDLKPSLRAAPSNPAVLPDRDLRCLRCNRPFEPPQLRFAN